MIENIKVVVMLLSAIDYSMMVDGSRKVAQIPSHPVSPTDMEFF